MSTSLCHDDAAYVLGALSPAERRTYEAHLAECPKCQQSVREFAGLPGLMTKVGPEDFDSPDEPVPATMLAALLDAVRERRTRQRWIGVLVAAAVFFVAAVSAVAIHGAVSHTDPSAGTTAMSQVVDSPLHASARLSDKPWGTQVDLFCRYDTSIHYGDATRTYALAVTDTAGRTRQIATWKVVRNGVSTISGSVDWHRSDIRRVEITTLDGSPILRLPT
jgi:hypothetical protein